MKVLNRCLLSTILVGAVMMISSCATYPDQRGAGYYDGPPPYSPEHGYRYRHQGHDIVYDANLGVYIVLGQQDYYYYDNNYYRRDGDRWYYSRDLNRDWRDHRGDNLPAGLTYKYSRDNRVRGYR